MWLRTLILRVPRSTSLAALALILPTGLLARTPEGGPERALRGDWAIEHVTIHPLARGGAEAAPLQDATVVVRAGVVRCVGRCEVPGGVPRHDGGGAQLLPGWVETAAHLGQVEVWAEASSHDGTAQGADILAHVRARDGLVLDSRVLEAARWGGVTAAISRPLGNALVVGAGVAFRTAPQVGGPAAGVEAAVLRPLVGIHVNLGESAKHAAGRPLVGARSGQIALLRAALVAARAELAAGAKRTAPDAGLLRSADRAALLALEPVLAGREPLVVHAHRAEDIAAALRLCQDEKLRMVLVGGAEAHLLAAPLAADKVPVVLAPVRGRALTFESARAVPDAAARLHRAGVVVAIATGRPHDARNLRWEAGFAVAHGMPADAALAAISIVPARIFGIEASLGARVGAAPGFVLVRGEPLGLGGRVVGVATGELLEIEPKQR